MATSHESCSIVNRDVPHFYKRYAADRPDFGIVLSPSVVTEVKCIGHTYTHTAPSLRVQC